jgi:DNA ligase-associated metallophosphoesterase
MGEARLTLTLDDEVLQLLPERALLWRDSLIFGDVHLGRAESLQAEGVAIPGEAGASDFARIADLIQRHHPREILILGDLIHQRTSWTDQLKRGLWVLLEAHPECRWKLLIGNHDRGSLTHLREFRIEFYENDLEIRPFVFAHGHHPSERFRIEGHAHPSVTLRNGPLTMRFPCFAL